MGHVNKDVRKPKQRTFLRLMQLFEKEVEKEFQERNKSTEVLNLKINLNQTYQSCIFLKFGLDFLCYCCFVYYFHSTSFKHKISLFLQNLRLQFIILLLLHASEIKCWQYNFFVCFILLLLLCIEIFIEYCPKSTFK